MQGSSRPRHPRSLSQTGRKVPTAASTASTKTKKRLLNVEGTASIITVGPISQKNDSVSGTVKKRKKVNAKPVGVKRDASGSRTSGASKVTKTTTIGARKKDTIYTYIGSSKTTKLLRSPSVLSKAGPKQTSKTSRGTVDASKDKAGFSGGLRNLKGSTVPPSVLRNNKGKGTSAPPRTIKNRQGGVSHSGASTSYKKHPTLVTTKRKKTAAPPRPAQLSNIVVKPNIPEVAEKVPTRAKSNPRLEVPKIDTNPKAMMQNVGATPKSELPKLNANPKVEISKVTTTGPDAVSIQRSTGGIAKSDATKKPASGTIKTKKRSAQSSSGMKSKKGSGGSTKRSSKTTSGVDTAAPTQNTPNRKGSLLSRIFQLYTRR